MFEVSLTIHLTNTDTEDKDGMESKEIKYITRIYLYLKVYI